MTGMARLVRDPAVISRYEQLLLPWADGQMDYVIDLYSHGSSEEILGRALRDFANRDDVVIATKLRHPMRPGPNGGGLSRKAVMTEADHSLRPAGSPSRVAEDQGPDTGLRQRVVLERRCVITAVDFGLGRAMRLAGR